MIITYKECIEKYKNDYTIKQKLKENTIYQISKGLYSTETNPSELEIITVKYPRAVFAGETAFYFHGLTDVIPERYTLATRRTDTRINHDRIEQIFMLDRIFDKGITYMDRNHISIRIYSLERMLVELVRFKMKWAYDYYKEIIGSFRREIDSMDFGLVEEYTALFSNGQHLMEIIDLEVL